jgi:hypothetical protein
MDHVSSLLSRKSPTGNGKLAFSIPSSQSPNLSTSQYSSIPSGKIPTTLQVKSTSSHDQVNTKPDESHQSPKTHYLNGDYQKQFHNSVTLGVDLELELEKCEV